MLGCETETRRSQISPIQDWDRGPSDPRRDQNETLSRSRDFRETETSRLRSSPWYRRGPTELHNYTIPVFTANPGFKMRDRCRIFGVSWGRLSFKTSRLLMFTMSWSRGCFGACRDHNLIWKLTANESDSKQWLANRSI